ncbi:MAG: molybdenum cofactor biosynthesis protein MoaE [Rickettsiaceae bacterium]|nr:molybdenum cofactor biosynthesis protein MoaE [Rickettsiaceae bacterium]
MSKKTHILITENKININQAIINVSDSAHGAVSSFFGMIRDYNAGKPVTAISYDVADELAIKRFHEITDKARLQWGEDLNIHIEHYKGRLEIGETSVAIAVSSPHREEAFQACRYIIEQAKHNVPIWKKEYYVNGESEWVKGHELCAHI